MHCFVCCRKYSDTTEVPHTTLLWKKSKPSCEETCTSLWKTIICRVDITHPQRSLRSHTHFACPRWHKEDVKQQHLTCRHCWRLHFYGKRWIPSIWARFWEFFTRNKRMCDRQTLDMCSFGFSQAGSRPCCVHPFIVLFLERSTHVIDQALSKRWSQTTQIQHTWRSPVPSSCESHVA